MLGAAPPIPIRALARDDPWAHGSSADAGRPGRHSSDVAMTVAGLSGHPILLGKLRIGGRSGGQFGHPRKTEVRHGAMVGSRRVARSGLLSPALGVVTR